MSSTISPPAAKSARKPSLPALTGIRTLLALNIVLFHFTPPYLGPFRPFVEHGFVFVNVFFLISGFILSYNYFDRGTSLVKRDFWMARFARLYPVYLLVLLISLPMLQMEWEARSRQEFFQGLILSPLLLQGWSPSLATFWNTVAWTLSCEVAFYAAFPWIIRAPWPKKPSRLVMLLGVLWVIDLLPAVIYLLTNPDHLSAPVDRYTSTTLVRWLKYTPIPYAATFLSGVTLSRLQLKVEVTPRVRMLLAAVALLGLGLFFYLEAGQVPYLALHGGLLLPLFSLLVFGLCGEHAISRVFAWGPLLLIGESTYCLYLLHFNVFNLIHRYKLPQRLHVAWLDPWVSYVALIVLSVVVYRFFENPVRKMILNRFPPTSRRQSSQA
ncbi:MAG: acyltransferase [Edaphobacter sp.]|uniref:acyltransferase family protein n=1 Tax=Edaphobacter sp. TaxID=1934404 RepID=UPI0023A17906|nr:acyltransferase [Edaphobacter sp.]MDE1175980.1 acyltransferase [Edaphobacter sp.]